MQQDIETIARNFLKALQDRTSPEELLNFYHPDIEQIEFPNALTRNKAVRNIEGLKEAAQRGKQILQKEEYDVINLYTIENTVIIEAIWTGTLAIALGDIPVGGQMKAYFAQIYEFRDDKIIRQRNYDCFEPFN